MFKMTDGLPPDVQAIEASGKATHADYRDELIPRVEAMMAKGPVRMPYVIGGDFTGFDPETLRDDSVFGLKHWHDFSPIAVVTDHAWLSAMINMFKPFIHGEVRRFSVAGLPAAKDWITGTPGKVRP